ncbi:hypothetical protein SAMN02745121_04307 [Nannocystis exedens]|uniref:Uncharacterized protein n=1 Tax=Nannocystis exedens TaxID=54 RepID=A0A1I2ASZ0_9BACT|nr:hypothetical protein [Nannocystis exedens]PCC74204.1 hypothetical protein NAEX_07293 [Nannocystis exedens]SFE46010.1 hypothetical protein SAMN02745121_04307 [Nannocystis exedens]
MSRESGQNFPINKAFEVNGTIYFNEEGSAYIILKPDFGLPIGTKIRRARRDDYIEIIPAPGSEKNGHAII